MKNLALVSLLVGGLITSAGAMAITVTCPSLPANQSYTNLDQIAYGNAIWVFNGPYSTGTTPVQLTVQVNPQWKIDVQCVDTKGQVVVDNIPSLSYSSCSVLNSTQATCN